MIKILFLIHDLGKGGAEKVLVNLVNNMDRNKFDITVMALFGGGVNEQFLDKDITFKTVFRKGFRGNSKVMKLFSPEYLHKKIIKEDYDIEVSYLEGPSARVISGCRNPRTKKISWIHIQQKTVKAACSSFRSRAEARKCYESFDKTVCVSEGVMADFCSLFPTIQNVSVAYNTYEYDKVLSLSHESVEENVFSVEEFRMCGIGKILPNKGFIELAKIHVRLRENGYPVHTYLLGDGKEKDTIEQYLKENDASDTFTFLGYQVNPYKYLDKCDLFVCTSKAEGFSTAAVEALFLGVPVITTPVAGMRELLDSYDCGTIVNTSDEMFSAIKNLIDHPEKLNVLKENAGKRGTCFSTEETVMKTEKIFLDIVNFH